MQDSVWEDAHNQVVAAHSAMAKICAQNPIEYRTIAMAAVEVALDNSSHYKRECLTKLMSWI